MNILILGGNRNFGKLVLYELLKKNHYIYLINRNSKKEKINHKNLTHIVCDRRELHKSKDLFKDIVFDYVFDNIAYKLEDVKILHKLLKKKIKHYIFTSSIITYLNFNDGYEARETDWPKGRIDNNWIKLKKYKSIDIEYALNKKKIEKYLINNKSIKSTILRVPNVVGKNDFSHKTQRLLAYPYKKTKDKNISGNDFIQFILKEDLVKVILRIIKKEKKQSEIYNVGNQKITIKDFYANLKKFSKKKYNSYTDKDFPIPVNSLMNCSKVKKKLNIRFSSMNKVLGLIS